MIKVKTTAYRVVYYSPTYASMKHVSFDSLTAAIDFYKEKRGAKHLQLHRVVTTTESTRYDVEGMIDD